MIVTEIRRDLSSVIHERNIANLENHQPLRCLILAARLTNSSVPKKWGNGSLIMNNNFRHG